MLRSFRDGALRPLTPPGAEGGRKASLRAANEGKVGARFKVPDRLIQWAVDYMMAFGCSYRAAAEVLSGRLRAANLPGISYSQLHRRIGRLDPHQATTEVIDARVMAYGAGARPRPRPVTVAVDSTGLTLDRPSGWMVERWNHRRVRGWYKLHAAYDRREYWNWLNGLGTEFVANIRGCFYPARRGCGSGRFRGCAVHGKYILRILEVGKERWKEEVWYGERWRIEATFGDTVRARARNRVADMIAFIVRSFNIFKSLRFES